MSEPKTKTENEEGRVSPLYAQAVSSRLAARVALALYEMQPTPESERSLRDAVVNAECKDALLCRFDPSSWSMYVAWSVL